MRDPIFITEADYERLERLIEARQTSRNDAPHLAELREELERAEILTAGQPVPPDVVTMNSEVKLTDLDSGETRVYRLTYPSDAHGDNALSVLAPIGTAILGYRVGSVVEWRVPRGIRRLQVTEVAYQPEAAARRAGEAHAA